LWYPPGEVQGLWPRVGVLKHSHGTTTGRDRTSMISVVMWQCSNAAPGPIDRLALMVFEAALLPHPAEA